MPRFHVHIYREMRLYFPDIEADTPEAAAAIASKMLTSDAKEIDDCDGTDLAALVDADGDTEYDNSKHIEFCRTEQILAGDTTH